MTRTALVVGGTGPTGPRVISGLLDKGYDVTILHRGVHEPPGLPDVPHLHADPHFPDSLREALGGRDFDVIIATYGRLRHVATAAAGRCASFVAVSGIPVYAGYLEPGDLRPRGLATPVTEEDAATTDHSTPSSAFAHKIALAEQHVLSLHQGGAFAATIVRYPSIYGPRQLYPREWSFIRRILDGRRVLILPDGGLTLSTRCAAANAAHLLTSIVDHPTYLGGQVFNVADDRQFTLRQWVEMIALIMGAELDFVTLPFEIAGPARDVIPLPHTDHSLLDTSKARAVLGHRDTLSPWQALHETVEWYVAHPPQADLKDAFDYPSEDRLVEAYRRFAAPLLATQQPARHVRHPYPHPKTGSSGADEAGR